MAGPSIAVKILADLKGFTTAVSGAGTHVDGAASRMRGAFSGVTAGLNQTGILAPFQGTLDGINTVLDTMEGKAKGIGTKLMGAGGAAAGIGAGLTAFGSKDQAAQQQLQQSIEATGGSYEDYAKSVEEAIGHQEKYGHTAGETQDALRKLTDATHDPQKAFDLLGEASDISASKHEDLSTAAEQLGKVYNGNTKLLKPFGIEIDKTTKLTKDGQTATEALAKVVGGQAAASADTFMGKLDGIKAKVEDSIAQFGQKYGPAIQAAGVAMLGLGAAIEVLPAIFGLLDAAWTAMGLSELIALGPLLLIIAAVAAVIAIGYVLYANWDTIWAAMQVAISAVWDWITGHWPLLLDILLGPIGIAVNLIIGHFDQIKAAAGAAVDFIRYVWSGLVGFFAAIWDGIRDGAAAAVTLITGFWEGLVGFITGLPARIESAVAGMWDGIYDAFRGVLNGVIDLWNSLHFTLPSIDLGPLGSIGGGDIGVPHIPHLATGGLITRTGLIYAHAGEAITPAAVRSAPAVNINEAHFHDDVDIDLFMRRAAWAARTGAL